MADLNAVLREDGADWRSEVDALRDVSATRAVHRPQQRRRATQWRAPLLAALAVVLVAAGLTYMSARDRGGRRDVALPTLSTAGTTRDSLKPAPSDEVAEATPRARPIPRTDATRGGVILSMHWRFLALLDGGRTILVSYAIGDPCDTPLGFRVQQGSNAVGLTALSNTGHRGCEQSLQIAFGTIRLDRPLGHRALLHATTDRH